MKKLLLVAVVLSLGSVASADMEVVITENTGPLTPTGYQSYVVSYNGATAGEELSAFDGNLTGTLLQAWYYVSSTRIFSTVSSYETFIAGEDASVASDTHLLVDTTDAAKVLIASSPEEDAVLFNPVQTTPDGYRMGHGTYMATTAISNMAFAIPSAHQALSTDLFQVVIPAGSTALLNGTVVANNGTSIVHVNTPIPVPEPATMGLLAIGGIGALIRRRRR